MTDINTFRETILKEPIYIGHKCGYAVTVRQITESRCDSSVVNFNDDRTDLPSYKRNWGTFKMKVNSPPIFVVAYGGVRLDSFLQKKNAMAYAKRFVSA